MKKLTIGLSATALAVAVAGGSIALAEPGKRQSPDADGDGVISRDEMQAHAANMFTRMDHNEDGKIDETDREARRAARREKMFDLLDANDDGQISKAEFNAKRERADGKHRKGGRRGQRGGRMMEMLDANDDGAVSQEELTAATMKRFDRFDADGDGEITKEERQKVRAEMRQKAQEMRKEPSGR